jgi:hypothetical protein
MTVDIKAYNKQTQTLQLPKIGKHWMQQQRSFAAVQNSRLLYYACEHVYRHGGANYFEKDYLSASNLHRKPTQTALQCKDGES